MGSKNGNNLEIPPLIFPEQDRSARAAITSWKSQGLIRKIAPRLYTSLPEEMLATTLRSSWSLIVSNLYPNTIVSHQTALTFKPNVDGAIFLTASKNRKLELPGLTLHFIRGPGVDDLDADFLELKVSSFPRALLENLMPANKSSLSRKLDIKILEERLEKELANKGEEHLNKIRDEARFVSKRLGFEKAFTKLDGLIGALLGTRTHKDLKSSVAIARSLGSPYDQNCLQRLDLLANELRGESLKEFTNYSGSSHYTNKAFFESYFSNYIEGTRFLVSEAERIIFLKEISQSRPLDSHDVLGTFQIASDPTEMSRTPNSYEELVAILKGRHHLLFAKRTNLNPGKFKTTANAAGNTVFVHPDYLEGTLQRGFERYLDLPEGLSRAAYMMFLISEVHPFDDGNGRVSRLMMNAELYRKNLSTIIIPNVYRIEYIDALRALTKRHAADVYVRMLTKAHLFSHIDFSNYANVKKQLTDNFWFEEATDIKIRIP